MMLERGWRVPRGAVQCLDTTFLLCYQSRRCFLRSWMVALFVLGALTAALPFAATAQELAEGPATDGMAEPGCDPEVRQALADSAEFGVLQDVVVIRNPDQGIRDPVSILDFSCIEDLFNYRSYNILFDPGAALEGILDLANRRICAAAREVYRQYVGRPLDASVYTSRIPRLPGLDAAAVGGNVLRDVGVDRRRFEKIIGGEE